jgi:transcriptional regulator GlxA family with amidase domain
MKHVTIMVHDGQVNMGTFATVAGSIEILNAANVFWKKTRGNPILLVQTAGISNKVDFSNGLIRLRPELSIGSIKKTDLVIVPPTAIRGQHEVNKGNRRLISWIGKQYKLGAEVASMCSGVFMLASTGILDGKSCSAHWAHAPEFRDAFPEVSLREDMLITHESGIYTNGGAYSFLNMLLFLVEKFFDRETAVYCSKMFQIDIERSVQSGFAIFSGQKKHGDDTVLKAQQYIEKHFRQKISIESLTDKFAVGRRNFDRRFVKATGVTPLDYLQRVKIEAAKMALENSRKTVNEVMYEVGYNDSKAFRDVFSRVAGMSPHDYRSKYNRDKSSALYGAGSVRK